MSEKLDATRRSITATLGEIVQVERASKAAGDDIADADEWQQLGEIVQRIEAKLLAKMAEKTEAEQCS